MLVLALHSFNRQQGEAGQGNGRKDPGLRWGQRVGGMAPSPHVLSHPPATLLEAFADFFILSKACAPSLFKKMM